MILHNLPATRLLSNNTANSTFFVKSRVRHIGPYSHNRHALKCHPPASHPLLEPPPSAIPKASQQTTTTSYPNNSQPPSLPDTTPQGPRLPRIFVRPRGRMTKMSPWLSLAPCGSLMRMSITMMKHTVWCTMWMLMVATMMMVVVAAMMLLFNMRRFNNDRQGRHEYDTK